LPFLLYVGLTPIFVRRRVDRLGAEAREGLGRMTAHVTDTIQGLGELVAFQAIPARRTDFLRLVADYHKLRLTAYRDLSLQSAMLEIATGLGGLSVAVTGAWLAASGHLEPTILPLLTLLSVSCRYRPSCRYPRSPMSAGNWPTRLPPRTGCRRSIAKRSR
jgi:ATP-binding cassette subfamily C protein CydCD